MALHQHRRVQVGTGFIRAPRVISHPASDDTEIPGVCSLCGEYVWLTRRTVLHRRLKPAVPVLCCCCSEISVQALSQVFPDWDSTGYDVPDLAAASRYN